MKKKPGKILVAMALFNACVNSAVSQNQPTDTEVCKTSEMVKRFQQRHPGSRQEQEENERFTERFITQSQNVEKKTSAAGSKYIIPCVFHVYGTTQGGKTVNH